MQTHKILRALRQRYDTESGEYAFMTEVASKLGHTNGRRYCDAIAMRLWSSGAGNVITGHEIKASRSDWLNELDNPDKAEAFRKRCHFWYIVAPKGIVKIEELPPEWGLMVATEKGTRIKSRAKRNEIDNLDFNFVASMLRSITRSPDNWQNFLETEISKAKASVRKTAYDQGVEHGKHSASWELSTLKSDRDSLRKVADVMDEFLKNQGRAENFLKGLARTIDSHREALAALEHSAGKLADQISEGKKC